MSVTQAKAAIRPIISEFDKNIEPCQTTADIEFKSITMM